MPSACQGISRRRSPNSKRFAAMPKSWRSQPINQFVVSNAQAIQARHERLTICQLWVEVCCTRMSYFEGERFNIYTHVVAFVVFVGWAIVNQMYMHKGDAATAQTAFLISLAIVFGVSALYHTHQARQSWARWLRVVDYLCIYAAMSVQSIFIVLLVARATPDRSIPWQSLVDPIAAVAIVTAVTVGREVDALTMGINTYVEMGPCKPCRYAHVDGEHTVMRIGINVLFTGQWILYVSMIYDLIEPPFNLLLICAMALSTIIVTVTQVNDYYNLSGAWSKYLPYPHGIFHVAAAACTMLMAGMNELVLRESNR